MCYMLYMLTEDTHPGSLAKVYKWGSKEDSMKVSSSSFASLIQIHPSFSSRPLKMPKYSFTENYPLLEDIVI